MRYYDERTIAFGPATRVLRTPVYRCRQPSCPLVGKAYRSELEGCYAPPFTKYSIAIICLAGHLSRETHGTASLQRLLAEFGVIVPLRSIPSLVDRFEALLSGYPQNDIRAREVLNVQGCAVLDAFSIQFEEWNACYSLVQELLSPTLLALRPVNVHTAHDIQKLITDVGRAMPVPVIGFASEELLYSAVAVQHLLKYSGKGPDRYCQIPRHSRANLSRVSNSLTRMVRKYHAYRNGNLRHSQTASTIPPSQKSRHSSPSFIGSPIAEVPHLAKAEITELWPILQDWLRSGEDLFAGDLNYDYNWDISQGVSPRTV